MEKALARSISELCRLHTAVPGFALKRTHGGRPFRGFHPWVDDKPILSIDHVRRDDGVAYLLLVIAWRNDGSWYVVVFPESRSQPLVEIQKVARDGHTLIWRYPPRKQDGRNAERVSYFKENFGDVRVMISVPTEAEELAAFLGGLFDLVKNRMAADELRQERPERRDAFPEGIAYERMHTHLERNREVVLIAKRIAKDKHGRLACHVCDFDFARTYGALGRDFIEAHHTIPLSELKGPRETRVEDLALVCANCHRMLHRRRPWLGMAQLKMLLSGSTKPPNKALTDGRPRTVGRGRPPAR